MTYPAAVLADSPLVYARLGGADATQILIDSSGNARTATLTGSGFAYAQPALIVDHGGDPAFGVSAGGLAWSSTAWVNVSSLTCEAWIHCTSLTANRWIWERDQAGALHQFQFGLQPNGKLWFAVWTTLGGPYTFSSTAVLSVNTTYHVAATYEASTGVMALYVDGVAAGTFTTPTPRPLMSQSMPALVLGYGYAGGGSPGLYFQGRLDEAAVYGTALSAARILAHYQAGVTAPAPTVALVKVAANRSHEPVWRVRMFTATGAQIGDPLPFVGGSISKTNAVTPRCSASVDVPTGLVPGLIDQNYLPTGQRLVFEYRIQNVGDWMTVADLDLVSSEITRPDSMWRLEAADRSIRVALDDTARGGWTEPTGTISAAVEAIVNRTFPGSVFAISGPAATLTVPVGVVTDGDPWSAAIGWVTAAQSEVFHRAHDRVWVVRPVPVLGTPVDTISVGEMGVITQYTLTHEMGFNTVALSYRAKDGGTVLRVGTWVDTRPTSPVAVTRIGSHVVYRETRDVDAAPTQVEADAAAAAVGLRESGRARSPSIRHVARPWLEPGDTIEVTYAGGPTELQLIDSVTIPLDNTNIQTTVARTSEYQMGPVV